MNTIKISKEFKLQTIKTILSILIFVLVYLLLILGALALTAFCIFGGIAIIMFNPSVLTFIIGIGFASIGLFVTFFLIKFIFKENETNITGLIEIKEHEEPKLFSMINDIVIQVDTNFPKKVFLSKEVNAAVFYNSNFLSMFFPVRKNLMIGMGLINTLTEQELKATLAHEFGHFSQKSMKIGSYVYNVNKVIYNMLFDNSQLSNSINQWTNINGIFSIFVLISIKIIEGIQWVLRQIYRLINKNYMALSREMEFHADEVAAQVAGYNSLGDALLRLDLAQAAYSSVLEFYDKRIAENKKTNNIYPQQSIVINKLAEINEVPFSFGFPMVTLEQINKYNKSKLIVIDQWASHPSTEDRLKALEKTGIKIESNYIPAINLLQKKEYWQESLTQNLFANIKYEQTTTDITNEEFNRLYCTEIDNNLYPKCYNGYYDNKNIFDKEIAISLLSEENTADYSSLFNSEKTEMILQLISMKNDIANIENLINHPELHIKTFDYDGQKYKLKNAKELLIFLKRQEEILYESIQANDLAINRYFYQLAKKTDKEADFLQLYNQLVKYHTEWEQRLAACFAAQQYLSDIYYTTNSLHEVNYKLEQLKKIETDLKQDIKKMLIDSDFDLFISEKMRLSFNTYISRKLSYISDDTFVIANINLLQQVLNDYHIIFVKQYSNAKKDLLQFQSKLLEV